MNKANRRNGFQFYWYYDSTYFGQPFCPSSGVHSRTSALVHFMQFDDRLLPGAGWKWMWLLLVSCVLTTIYITFIVVPFTFFCSVFN
jgi:hypothetical protein